MYTDDPIFIVVGVDRALRALRVWRQLTDSVQQTQAMLKAQNRGFKEQTAGLGKTVEEARRREAAAAQEARELERAVAQKKSALRRAGAAPPKARSRSTAGKPTTVPTDANPADWVAATGAVLDAMFAASKAPSFDGQGWSLAFPQLRDLLHPAVGLTWLDLT